MCTSRNGLFIIMLYSFIKASCLHRAGDAMWLNVGIEGEEAEDPDCNQAERVKPGKGGRKLAKARRLYGLGQE